MKSDIVLLNENIEGLREFVQLIKPVLEEHKAKLLQENPHGTIMYSSAMTILEGTDEENRNALVNLLEEKCKATLKEETDEKGRKSVTLDYDNEKYPALEKQFRREN